MEINLYAYAPPHAYTYTPMPKNTVPSLVEE